MEKETQRLQILLVDDDPNMVLLVKDFLEFRGYAVVTAGHGADGLKVLDNGFIPDVIISDVMMPEMDGYEFISQLHESSCPEWVPIIFLSAKGQIQDRVKGLTSGAEVYMVKPFEPEELIAQIESVMRYALKVVESSRQEHSTLADLRTKQIISEHTFLSNKLDVFDKKIDALTLSLKNEDKEIGEDSEDITAQPKSSKSGKELEDYAAICGAVAHSLKNEFMHIGSSIEYISETSNIDDVREECEVVKRGLEYNQLALQKLLNYLDFSSSHLEEMDVGELLKKAECLIRPRLPSNIKLSINKQVSTQKKIKSSPVQVLGVVVELIDNAIKALRKQGGSINLKLENKNSNLLIFVEDDGPGLTTEIQRIIFKEAINLGESSGLGLFLGKKVLRGLGGDLYVGKNLSKGTTFIVSLPLSSP